MNLLINGHYYISSLELSWKIVRNPNDIMAFYNRGTVRSQYGYHRGAISDFTQAIKVRSRKPSTLVRAASAYFQRGQEYELMGETKRAILDYQTAAAIYKKYGEISTYEQVNYEIIRLLEDNKFDLMQ